MASPEAMEAGGAVIISGGLYIIVLSAGNYKEEICIFEISLWLQGQEQVEGSEMRGGETKSQLHDHR